MGREIRKVKKGWEHPKNEHGKYQPMFDEFYGDALNEWIENHKLWMQGKHPDQLKYPEDTKEIKYYAEWKGSSPNVRYYRTEKWDEEKDEMWFQLYEIISEGTPLSPSFKTKKELADYLVENGDFWGYKWTRNQADNFMEKEWCPTGIMTNGKFYKNQEQMDIIKEI